MCSQNSKTNEQYIKSTTYKVNQRLASVNWSIIKYEVVKQQQYPETLRWNVIRIKRKFNKTAEMLPNRSVSYTAISDPFSWCLRGNAEMKGSDIDPVIFLTLRRVPTAASPVRR